MSLIIFSCHVLKHNVKRLKTLRELQERERTNSAHYVNLSPMLEKTERKRREGREDETKEEEQEEEHEGKGRKRNRRRNRRMG